MITDKNQKLSNIVDRLLIKTQDDIYTWRKTKDEKYVLHFPIGTIQIYHEIVLGGTHKIKLEITRDNITLIEISNDKKNTSSNLVRLFNAVEDYYENYLNEFLDDILNSYIYKIQ